MDFETNDEHQPQYNKCKQHKHAIFGEPIIKFGLVIRFIAC